jgi:hypothetical protein
MSCHRSRWHPILYCSGISLMLEKHYTKEHCTGRKVHTRTHNTIVNAINRREWEVYHSIALGVDSQKHQLLEVRYHISGTMYVCETHNTTITYSKTSNVTQVRMYLWLSEELCTSQANHTSVCKMQKMQCRDLMQNSSTACQHEPTSHVRTYVHICMCEHMHNHRQINSGNVMSRSAL